MGITTRKRLATIFTILVAFFTIVQGMIPAMPIIDPITVKYTSAVFMVIVGVLTAWKQYVSNEIANNSLYATLAVAIVATLGAFSDFFNVITFSPIVSQWIRFSLTFLMAFVNFLSTALFPSNASKYYPNNQ